MTYLYNRAEKAITASLGTIDSMLAPYYNGRVKSIITLSSNITFPFWEKFLFTKLSISEDLIP